MIIWSLIQDENLRFSLEDPATSSRNTTRARRTYLHDRGPRTTDVAFGTPGGIAAASLTPPVFLPLDMCLQLCY